jgi:hydrogenase maturation protease
MGNPILRDDGFGPRLIEELRGHIIDPDITLTETSLSGVNLMEMLIGFDRAIIVDTIKSSGRPGKVYRLTTQDFGISQKDVFSEHNMSLFQSIELGKRLKLHMPNQIVIVAVEAENVTDFGESLTPAVEKAVPGVVEQILEELKSDLS